MIVYYLTLTQDNKLQPLLVGGEPSVKKVKEYLGVIEQGELIATQKLLGEKIEIVTLFSKKEERALQKCTQSPDSKKHFKILKVGRSLDTGLQLDSSGQWRLAYVESVVIGGSAQPSCSTSKHAAEEMVA